MMYNALQTAGSQWKEDISVENICFQHISQRYDKKNQWVKWRPCVLINNHIKLLNSNVFEPV